MNEVTVTESIQDAYVLASREVMQFFRRPARFLSFIIQPLILLLIFGLAGRIFRATPDGFPYVLFIIPGIIVQRLMTTASRGGMGLIRDRHGGFLREVLVAPVARGSILVGLSSGHVFRAGLQALLLLGAGVILGLRFGGGILAPVNLLICLAIVLSMGFAVVMLSMALAWKMDDQQNFSVVVAYATVPLFLLSGGLFSLNDVPVWLQIVLKLNPLTYVVDSLRYFALDPRAAHMPIAFDLLFLLGFLLVAFSVGLKVMRTKQAD